MKVDYDSISARYDSFRRGGGPYLNKLVSLASECRARHVLEIGAGTGLNTQEFLAAYPCRLTAIEPSAGMAARGKGKALDANWVRGALPNLPLANGCVDFVFGAYVLHYVADLERAFAECARVLRKGCAAFVTASPDSIDRHPMNRYFPSFAAVDKARFRPLADIERALRHAGFAETGAEHFVDAPRPIDVAYVEKVANRFISTLDLIPADEFAQGVARLRADVSKTGRLDVDIVWESVVVWGCNPRERAQETE